MEILSDADIEAVLSSVSDGVYACDLERRITYWSESAQRITGWSAEQVVGRPCFDNILCHIDKDGHQLCGKEHCPLHRAIITDTASKSPLLAFAQAPDGRRIPMHVRVVPARNAAGEVIGGVEMFRDASAEIADLRRAETIQRLALEPNLVDDARIRFTTHYVPRDIIGGDYLAVTRLDDDRYGLMLADVMGHGIAAALYTMHLSQLWDRYNHLVADPVGFLDKINRELVKVVRTDESFATAACGVVDLDRRTFRFAGAGGPPILLTRQDGTTQSLSCEGLPLAVMEEADYEASEVGITPGDRLLLSSDGILEVSNAAEETLGIDGLIRMLRDQGYPATDIDIDALEESLLLYSNAIRPEDDLTLLEARLLTP